MSDPVIAVRGLGKTFGDTRALDGLELDVPEGAVCGLLGPNGAGKTTLVRILATLVRPDRGEARVCGHDVARDAAAVRRVIGLAGQYAAVEEGITGRENLELLGRMHHLGAAKARARAAELLAEYRLEEAADRLVRGWSGGMRRRLDLAASLITRPRVLFLDEPTTGLDPRSRREIWSAVRELAAQGSTVLLTTQYLDEADRLADRITVLDRGRAVADDTPQRLKAAIGALVEVTLPEDADLERARAVLAVLTGGAPVVDAEQLRVSAVSDPARSLVLPLLVRELDAAGVVAVDVAVRTPSLDDVFLALTGAEQKELAA
ncbi:daunorubicin resistance protein DrrA family ABC transporter ATP-binding protein [Kitasatospora cheerisanensis]|uniref:ABC-type xenobiotic transporter n=1 Tax=Kitasatospora cheerisanensis KCTC 2395 TaxID=1348663 RepID=A0A066Z3S6_9ACTN|nr:daunorubicin resistance protein DrrA family ABC transporter ATP-binding protein [Kitasatospora cheerisanensis]KDN86899.1 ABC transporter [Kitasatospora cheerisanensis KCTC 2395]